MAAERFSEPEANVIESTNGFSIRVLGRIGLLYAEGDRTAWIDSEVLTTPRAIAIGMGSMRVWTTPTGSQEEVTQQERLRAGENIQRAFTACGYLPQFGPDAETRDALEWLRRKRPEA